MRPAQRQLPLAAAAALALRRLIKDEARQGLLHVDGMLDVAAIALAACIPVYSAERRLADEELLRGEFCHGATQLRFADGRPPLEGLAVRASDLDYALERLERAGVSFTHAQPTAGAAAGFR